MAGLVVGCSSSPPPAGQPTVAPSTVAGPAPTDPDTEHCRRYAASAASARTPLDAMRTQAVLGPFIALIELSTRQVAEEATSAGDATVAGAMRELVAAVDDVDAQAKAALPPGADATATPVRLDPTRLAAALDAADRACAPRLAGSPLPTR